jgi:putative copper export protein
VGSDFGVESPAFVAIRGVLSLCTIGLLGVLALRWAVMTRYAGPDSLRLRAAIDARLPRWIDVFGVIAVAATLARLVAQHAAVFGTEESMSRDSLATLLFRSGWGRTWWIALIAAVVVTWIAPRLRRGTPLGWIAAAVAVVVLAVSQPLSGHPAAAETPTLAVATQLLHVIGAGGWVGSLALLTLLAIPVARSLDGGVVSDEAGATSSNARGDAPYAPDARIAGLVRAFSPTALGFAALLGITGVLTAWEHLGGFAPLWQSTYGRTLLVKLGFLSVAVATGAYNWRRVLPVLGEPQASARLRRSSLIELTAAVLVIAVTAVLVASPMPGE